MSNYIVHKGVSKELRVPTLERGNNPSIRGGS